MAVKEKRQKQILNILHESSPTTTKNLVSALGVSAMTIRRDIAELENLGLVDSFYGGIDLKEADIAQTVPKKFYSMEQEKVSHFSEKIKIAEYASTLIDPFDSIAIDNGTTCCNILDFMKNGSSYMIYSYALEVINKVAQKNDKSLRLFALGGYYHNHIKMFECMDTTDMLKKIHINKFFIGAVGVDASYGLSCAQAYEISIRKALMEVSDTNILLADSSKIGKSWYDHYANIEDIDIFITDSGISDKHREELESKDIKLIVI